MWWGILKRDMSYCVCSGPNKTKGFTCKAHCRSKQMKKADPKEGNRKETQRLLAQIIYRRGPKRHRSRKI